MLGHGKTIKKKSSTGYSERKKESLGGLSAGRLT